MSSILTILLTLFVCGIVSIILFACGYALMIVGLANGMSTPNSLGIWEWPLVILCALVFLSSFLVCPLGAYFIRQTIFDLTGSLTLRILTFALVAGIQLITIGSVYLYSKIYSAISQARRIERLAPSSKLVQKVMEAGVRVHAKRAIILKDSGQELFAEITLRIENVPLDLPSYEIYFSRIDNMFGEFDVEPYSENEDLPKPWIKATSENGKWHFEEIGIHQVLSDDSDEVTFQIEISRRNTNSTALPTSITPILLIRWKDLNASLGSPILDRTDPIFFDSTIPIDFER